MTNHDFRRTNEVTKAPDMNLFWCKKCDSKVLFKKIRSERDVNFIMDNSKLKCLPPIVGKFKLN